MSEKFRPFRPIVLLEGFAGTDQSVCTQLPQFPTFPQDETHDIWSPLTADIVCKTMARHCQGFCGGIARV